MPIVLLIASLFVTQIPNRVVVGSGQSNVQGGDAAIPTAQVLGNKMVAGIVYDGSSYISIVPSPAWPLTDLVETTVQSPLTSLGNAYATTTGYPIVIALDARGGHQYSARKIGTLPFTYALNTIQAVAEHATCATVVGAYDVGGETDQQQNITRIQAAADMVEHQAAITAGARIRLPLTGEVPLCITQFSSWTSAYSGGLTTSTVAMGYFDASVASDYIEIANPGYIIPVIGDTIHYTAAGQNLNGRYAAKCLTTPGFKAVRPSSVSRSGAVITVTFYGMVLPLLLTCTAVTDPGNYGFEYYDDSSPPAILSVVQIGADTFDVTLASTPVGANKRIRVAYTGTTLSGTSSTAGPRSCLHTSDVDLPDYAVHSDTAVP